MGTEIFGLVKFLLGYVIPPLLDRPEVEISHSSGSRAQYGQPTTLEWHDQVTFHNPSGFNAYRLALLCPTAGPPFLGLSLPRRHLGATEATSTPFTARLQLATGATSPPGVSLHDHFAPPVFRSFQIVLEYRNRTGKRFYTHFIKQLDGQVTCTYHPWRKPRVAR